MSSSEFVLKIDYYYRKKESLFDQSKFKYTIRSMFAGAFLTFSTAAGAIGADLLNSITPSAGCFLFPFVFKIFMETTQFIHNFLYIRPHSSSKIGEVIFARR